MFLSLAFSVSFLAAGPLLELWMLFDQMLSQAGILSRGSRPFFMVFSERGREKYDRNYENG
jgi:hypothetical protein